MLRNNSEIIAELNFCSTAIHGRSAADVSPAYTAALTRPVRESSYLDIKVRYTKRLIIHALEHSNSGKKWSRFNSILATESIFRFDSAIL